MAKFNPRNRNPRHDAPPSWSQHFYDNRPRKNPPAVCGFVVGGVAKRREE